MAVVTRSCGGFPCVISTGSLRRSPKNGRTMSDIIKTQLCTLALSLAYFNCVRLPREAFKYGTLPYLLVYSFFLLVVGLPTSLLQLAIGQLSQQDPVGVWRAVPILRGVGHLKILTSYLCCIYTMMHLALSAAYLIWIAKGSFPLKDCTKLQMTPHGYENKMNASECFNSTFLAPFAVYPQYLGIMAILVFILWFFMPVLLYRLRKSLKVALDMITVVIVCFIVVLCTFLANSVILDPMLESCQEFTILTQPYIWQSGLVQSLLTTFIFNGYLISAGGTVYRNSDIRWTSTLLIIINLLTSWFWVFFWESIGGRSAKDTSFVSILVLIYQSSVVEKRNKEWPLIAFGLVFGSGLISMLTLLFPFYDKLHRLTGENWRLVATISSAVGTALTVVVTARGLEIATILDELIIPVLAVFTTALEVVGFVFIYGWCYLQVDIKFLTGIKLPWIWTTTWWIIPVLILSVSGWWLREVLQVTWAQIQTLWPLVGVFVGIVMIMVVLAAVAVAKEEQYNLLAKIAAAFKPSRLWGPEEPTARYIWMSQRYAYEVSSNGAGTNSDSNNYVSNIINKYHDQINTNEDYRRYDDTYKNLNVLTRDLYSSRDLKTPKKIPPTQDTKAIHRTKKNDLINQRYRSPNICIAKSELGGPIDCNCNRHFTLNVPNLKNSAEGTTSL